MKLHTLLLNAAVLAVIAGQTATGRADTPAEAFAGGKALLAQADFQGALKAFASAARADRTNQEYLQHFAMVRQVITLREQLDAERDADRWDYIARGLHAFYISHGLYDESLALNQRVHSRLNTAYSALTLAETQLALSRCGEAAETLSKLDPSKHTAATRALLGLALARQGKTDQAREIAGAVKLPADVGPGTIYAAARLNAAIGSKDEALTLLERCFQSVAPSLQSGYKDHARRSPEFAALASSAEFAKVLETTSKVPESKCSGGAACSGCPMRGQCAHSQGR